MEERTRCAATEMRGADRTLAKQKSPPHPFRFVMLYVHIAFQKASTAKSCGLADETGRPISPRQRLRGPFFPRFVALRGWRREGQIIRLLFCSLCAYQAGLPSVHTKRAYQATSKQIRIESNVAPHLPAPPRSALARHQEQQQQERREGRHHRAEERGCGRADS